MNSGATNPATGAAAHPIMFWVLTGMALAIFAPCVLVPIWVESKEIRDYEQALAGVVSELDAQATQNYDRIEAIQSDPLVNERIVRRELNVQPQGEQIVQWSPTELTSVKLRLPSRIEPDSQAPQVEDAGWISAAGKWLPRWPWRELFAKSPNRPLLLAMSGGLLVAAFVLYGRVGPSVGAAPGSNE